MANLQQLTTRQVDEALQAAADREVPATITIRRSAGWLNFRTRMLRCNGGHLWLELPSLDEEGQPRKHEFQPADKIGVSFKLKHHKHIFMATVAGVEAAGNGLPQPALKVCCPVKVHRMQRRIFERVDVPPRHVVRASFWLGGVEAEPAGVTPEHPVWSGRVINLSAGGLQLSMADEAFCELEIGETVGVRVIFGAGDETVYADAQFRHLHREAGEVKLGFQFVGLGQTAEGKQALELIGTRVADFHRELPQRTGAHARAGI
jgi:c-di-GMP-binding flagellar brake protein YcgR